MPALKYVIFTALLLVAPGLPTAVGWAQQQQQLRASLFEEADRALQDARTARADILAPRSYSEGMKRYREAEESLERGRKLDDIREKLRAASQYFAQAIGATELANVTLASALGARDDAEAADAPGSAPELWRKADEKFYQAARELERGDVNDARKRADESGPLFREAELAAIKTAYLRETWELLAWAEEDKVVERAPRTLARAEQLADEAEQLLSQSRYDTDHPRVLAQQARTEAQHAIYLATVIRAIEEREATFEDAMLAAEDEVRRIAGSMDIPASFERGLGETTAMIIERIEHYQERVQTLERDVADRAEEVEGLEARVAELTEQLGGIAEERTELVRRMEAQAQLRQRFTDVEQMFARDEARVLREGDDVIIRLVGLTFPVGKSTIDPAHYGLLTTVQQAINIFPGSRVTVEGHTDSFGSDSKNLQLSQERAQAVRQYLLANMLMDSSLIDAIGYGEDHPVASDGTEEGRARNRRTDIVIHARAGL